ncbi:MAG: hypothetical protein MK194_06375 [Roseibacillus sp.]|nr:hypothetical protein [Roseibacillus sp.]
MRSLTLLLASLIACPCLSRDLEFSHPLPDYAACSPPEITAFAAEVRRSNPQIHRGGWEWDRLLSRYIDNGRQEKNAIPILKAYFMSILDRYDAATEKGEQFTLFYNHKSWGSGGRMRIFAELVRQKAIGREEQEKFKTLVTESLRLDFPDYSALERGVNNRPYGINGGPALAVQMFPGHPLCKRHRPWLDALWRELAEYGDTTETNYYPYGPLYLQGLYDMAQGMGKFETERDFLYQHLRRYLSYVHGGGVRGNPNSGVRINQEEDARARIYADPWNSRYLLDEAGGMDGHIWYLFAKEFKDPEFLWASEQACLGGRPPPGIPAPREYLEAYQRRYGWFIKRGIEPRVPSGRSAVGYYSKDKHRKPERLFLCPGRESGQPFVSFYIYDRNNNYMHYCDDSDGKLYEYCVDGAKFLHTSGKYSSGRAGVGEGAYDLLTVLPPDMKFPMKEGQGMEPPTGKSWKMASMSIKVALPSREGPDSKNWFFDDKIGKFRRRDQPGLGFSYGNMDGYWNLNDDYHLTSLRIGDFAAGTRVQNIRLAGPGGEKVLAPLHELPDNMKVELRQGEHTVELTGARREAACRFVKGGRRPGTCLEVSGIGENSSLRLTLENLEEKFNGQTEYTRMAYDFKGPQGGSITPNVRTNPRYFTPLWHRGAILEQKDLRAENKGTDSFGRFTMRNYYGARSRWTRECVLTAEGYLIVRDRLLPCGDLAGYHASPCWLISATENAQNGPNWFEAPARDHAWWQTRRKRLLLHLHQEEELVIGQVEHRVSQDIGGANVRNTFARATLQPGKPQFWLSVLRPFNEGVDARKIATGIQTRLAPDGTATATVGPVTIQFSSEGGWSVSRPTR